jgi:hypothetical protein
MGYNGFPAEHQDGPYDGYAPIIEAVSKAIGVPVTLWSTGGNCMALGAVLDGGGEIVITDGDFEPLSPWQWREDAKAGRSWTHPDGHAGGNWDSPVFGYLVSVRETHGLGDAVCYVCGPNTETPEGVVTLVQRALEEARAHNMISPGDDNSIELPEVH